MIEYFETRIGQDELALNLKAYQILEKQRYVCYTDVNIFENKKFRNCAKK